MDFRLAATGLSQAPTADSLGNFGTLPTDVTGEVQYVVLLFCLFVVPRVLQRLGVPAAITSLLLGVVAGMGLGLFRDDATITLLSTLGIVSLFLFAGLEVRFDELAREKSVLAQHLAIAIVAYVLLATVASRVLNLAPRAAALVSLALLTPSTGFILDSLGSLGLAPRERFWVKSQAIATEILALLGLFVVLQSTTVTRLVLSVLVLAAMVVFVPVAFRGFAAWVAPYAPKSEFAFLVMVAVVCAFVTLRLGVYYLVGAFVVGAAAQQFRQRMPAMASEQMLHAVEVFASFFVPFYFFQAGSRLSAGDFGPAAAGMALLALLVLVPFRVGVITAHRRAALSERVADARRIGVALVPTLVFTLVIAGILRDRFATPSWLYGSLVLYTLLNTLVPAVALRARAAVAGPEEPPRESTLIDPSLSPVIEEAS